MLAAMVAPAAVYATSMPGAWHRDGGGLLAAEIVLPAERLARSGHNNDAHGLVAGKRLERRPERASKAAT